VIAFVITIAGARAAANRSHFPDIVPPQVTVTATFPGASAEVVIERRPAARGSVVGVDKMLYEVDERQ
jgi:hypothetical protein